MKKIQSLFLNTILLFLGGLAALIAFTSCENFLAGGEIRKEIEEKIAYNNAKDINVLIMPEIGTGTIVQNTNYTAKLGYPFEISFTEASEYSFVEWIAVDKNNPEKKLNEGVIFDDAHSATTKVKISTDSVAVKIIPSCEKRIALSVEPSPRYDPLGVSRDRSITVTFTKPLSRSSFIYAENEIPAGAQTKINGDGEIWAYSIDGQTYLKNISITNADDYSIAEHFTCPLVNDKLLTIAVDKNEPIKFNSGEVFKTVKVTLSKDICDTKGIKMNTEKSWNYQITESTDDKASVNLTSDKGSVYLAGTKDYSIGQKITLALTEDADYQFVRWDYDSSIIYIAEPENLNTTATVLEKTQGDNTTQIKALCAPRLRVLDKGFSPVNDSENPTVSKNSSIIITFNQNLPDDEEGKKQLENISITIGGSPVKSSFKAPVISENTITFAADNSNMLDVPAGQTKTVSVTVPADLYYKLDDGTKVSYGANGISFNYKIDETTLNKAEITVSAASGSGTLKGASGSGRYSIGQEVSLVFEPADGWRFNGWSITCGGEAVPESQIKIADKNALSTKLTVYEALAGLLVTAKTSECLSFTASPSAAVNPKDSEIKITFNKNLASDCASLLDKILINSGDLDDYYETRELDGNTITIKNTSPLSVAKDATKLITVTVPSDFYYMNDGNKVNLERKSFSFKVNHTTIAKTKVTYSVINGENDSAFNPSNAAGSIEGLQSNLVQYNIGEEVPLSFALADGYQFYGWKITDANGNLVTDTVSYKNNTSASSLQPTLEMKKAAEGLKISAVCYKRPSISTSTVTPYNANSATEVAKNTAIVLTFAHKIKSETKDAIIVNYSAISDLNKKTYFSTSISEDEKTVTLTPIKMLPLNNSFETVTVTVPHDKVYYLASDGKTKITSSDEDFSWSYKINSSTEEQTEVRFATTDAAQTGRQINVGGTLLSSGTKQKLNIEQSVNLEFPIAEPDKYKFAGWKVTTATSGYTVTPSSYVTSGEITVMNGNNTYFTLIVDSNNPNKATITSSAFMSNGTDGYGITVSAKDVELPNISTFSPAAASNAMDSTITITFDKALASACSSELNQIHITMDGNTVDDFFETRTLSGKTITIKNTKSLGLTGTTTKTIAVTIPPVFYYEKDGLNVYIPESKTYTYVIDSTTTAKTKLRFYPNESSNKKLNVNGTETNNGATGTYNMGETINLEYLLPADYKFLGWKLVPYSSAYTVSPTDYVSKGSITVKKDGETYFTLQINDSNPTKATATCSYGTISGSSSYGLTIMAKDTVIPKVISFSPVSYNELGERCDSPIQITFNKPVDKNTVTFSSTGSIQIMDSDETRHLESYFNTPTWSDNKLTINPKFEIKNLFKTEDETIKLKVKINYTNIKDSDGNAMMVDPSWIYRINHSMETDAPIVSMTLYKPQYNPTEVSGSYNSVPTGAIIGSTNSTQWAARQIKNKIYFDATASDSGSGYKQLTLKETYIRTTEGTSQSIVYPVTTYTSSSFTKQPYNLQSELDGIIQLDFIFEDRAGNKNTKTYYVVRDTSIEATVVLTPAAVTFTTTTEANIAEQGSYSGQNINSQMGASVGAYKKLSDIAKANLESHIPNASKMITETLDFSNSKDSIYNSSYAKFDATYEVKYGYSETSITNNATKQSQTKYTFTRDVTKDCFVKITAYDAVGNSDSIMRVFPKQVSIVNMPLVSSSPYTYYNMVVSNMDYMDSLAGRYSALDAKYLFIFKFKPKGSSSFSSDVKFAPPAQGKSYDDGTVYSSAGSDFYLSNQSFTDATLTPDGTYYIYVLPYLRYSERNYYGAASEPYIFYHNVTSPSSSATPTFGTYTANIASAVASTGVRNVSVTTGFTRTTGFTYGVRYNKTGTTDYKYADFNFTVPSGASYELYLYAKNNTTNQISVGSTKRTIDATYDNVPPIVKNATGNTIMVSPNQIITNNVYPYDEGVGLITDASTGLSKFNYYLIKKNDDYTYSKIERSDLEGLTPRSATVSDGVIQLDFDCFIEGTYIIVFDLEDKNGNKGLYSYTINNHVSPGVQKLNLSTSSTYCHITGSVTSQGYNLNANYMYYLTDGKWKYHTRDPFYSIPNSNTFLKFFKAGSRTISTGVNSAPGYSLCGFISTDYMRKWKSAGTPPECLNKAMLPAYGNAFVINYDAPCLVHTMIYPTDRVADFEATITKTMSTSSVDRETAAAAVWASKGMERGLRLVNTQWYDENKTSTYSAPLDEIPSGYSYVVITHFADGSTAMSDVRQK